MVFFLGGGGWGGTGIILSVEALVPPLHIKRKRSTPGGGGRGEEGERLPSYNLAIPQYC